MRNLKCHQESCKFNSNYFCVKNKINISEKAECLSYVAASAGFLDKAAFEIGSMFDEENPSPSIKCNNRNCSYNKNSMCNSNNVLIGHDKQIMVNCKTSDA